MGSKDAPMMDSMIVAARQEYSQLRLKAEAINKRIEELEIFLRVAQTIGRNGSSPIKPAKPATLKDQIISTAQEVLANGKFRPTRDIVAAIDKEGIELKGTESEKVLRVSSILVREKDKFVSERGKGWALRVKGLELPKR
jgi:hypothetical protein